MQRRRCGYRLQVLELWRKDAVYTFDFGPDATLQPLREIGFVVNGSTITVKYLSPGDYDYESARDVVAELDHRGREQNCEKLPVVSSGVLPLPGIGEEAWRCELDYAGGEAAAEVIGRAERGGLVITLERTSLKRQAAAAGRGMLEPLVHRVGVLEAGLKPRADELLYILGPLQVLAPQAWDSEPRLDVILEGRRPEWVRFYKLSLAFAVGSPDAHWMEVPNWVNAHLVEEDMLAEGGRAEQVLPDRTVVANCWAAVPHPPEPGDPCPPDPVETTAVAVVDWDGATLGQLMSIQRIPYEAFEGERDLVKLRDFVMQAAMSCSKNPRVGG